MCWRRRKQSPDEKSASGWRAYTNSLFAMILACLTNIGLAGAGIAKTTSGSHGLLAGHIVVVRSNHISHSVSDFRGLQRRPLEKFISSADENHSR
jgi:Na+-driven multidrug efflux pump